MPRNTGTPPGSAIYTGEITDTPVHVHIIDYSADLAREMTGTAAADLARYRSIESTTWINLDGIHRAEEVQAICRVFNIHPLWIEDILSPESRPKSESLRDQLLVIMRMVVSDSEPIETEQVTLIQGPGWVLTFQEHPGDVWTPLRNRIQSDIGRIRQDCSDYLLHALIDSVVDNYFIALEGLEARVDAIEEEALTRMAVDLVKIYALKAEVGTFRAAVWPMREVVGILLRNDGGAIQTDTLPFFRDLSDHVLQVKDAVETCRERVMGVFELHLAVTSHRLNEIMRVLTVVSTVFIPLTFLVGVYGMNFHHMPELAWKWSYPVFWVVSGAMASGSWLWFKRRGWL